MKPNELVIGGRYNWKYQTERLIYLGSIVDRTGRWHQFALVERPDNVWCEVVATDLEYFEETK